MLYLGGVLELRPHVRHAADVVDVQHLIVKVKVHVVSVRLKGAEFPAFKDVLQHLAATRAVLIIIHGYPCQPVHQAPYILFPVLPAHLHTASRLVAVHYRVLLQAVVFQVFHDALEEPGTLFKPVRYRLAGQPHPFLQQACRLPVHRSVEEEAVEHEVGHQVGSGVSARNAFNYRFALLSVHGEVTTQDLPVLVPVDHYLMGMLGNDRLLVVCVPRIRLDHDSAFGQLAQVAPVIHVVVRLHRAVGLAQTVKTAFLPGSCRTAGHIRGLILHINVKAPAVIRESRQSPLSRPYAVSDGSHRPCPLPSSLSETCTRKGACVRP